ncbi:MAG TPA: HAD-IA family hydrolase [Gemmatimonadales bacterium]|nr:HAD-IA family hydrolase [Gemmatimonadales bacterium]
MAGSLSGPYRAILFDAGNTLLFLDYPRLAESVGKALGIPLSAAALAAAAGPATEAMEGSRAAEQERAVAFFEALFRGAGVPEDRLGELRECLAALHGERHLWSRTAVDAPSALSRLRAAGLKLGVVSNSDGRVESALEAAGLREYFDVVIDSALAGVEKPDPAIFRAALAALEVSPGEALYVGDLYEIDVLGARAAGLAAVLLLDPADTAPDGCRTFATLAALTDDLLQERVST